MIRREEVENRVLKVVMEYTNQTDISLETPIKALDLDSLDGYEIVMALEEEFKVFIPDDDFSDIRNVRGYVKLVEASL